MLKVCIGYKKARVRRRGSKPCTVTVVDVMVYTRSKSNDVRSVICSMEVEVVLMSPVVHQKILFKAMQYESMFTIIIRPGRI